MALATGMGVLMKVKIEEARLERLLLIESSATIQVILWERETEAQRPSAESKGASPTAQAPTRTMQTRAKQRLIAAVRSKEEG